MRNLVTIRTISDIQPIPGADAIDVATVDGWKLVVKKGEFQVGEQAVYFEIDSWIPTEIAPFLSKGKEPKEFHGISGERLQTIKLKGQLSQGLLLPLKSLEHYTDFDLYVNLQLDDDLTDILHIQLYEPPVKLSKNGLPQINQQSRGNFPVFIPKTDHRIYFYSFFEILPLFRSL